MTIDQSQFDTVVSGIDTDRVILNTILTGDDSTTVTAGSQTLPSVAKLFKDITDASNAGSAAQTPGSIEVRGTSALEELVAGAVGTYLKVADNGTSLEYGTLGTGIILTTLNTLTATGIYRFSTNTGTPPRG